MISRKLKAILLAGMIAAVAVIGPMGSPAPATAMDNTTLFVNLTTDDTWTAQMALAYADKVLEMGHPVVVFLNVRGVRLADRKIPQERGGLSGKTAKEVLANLIAKGATIYVCPSCTEQAGMTKADWIDGVKPGGPETINVQMAPMTKVMSF